MGSTSAPRRQHRGQVRRGRSLAGASMVAIALVAGLLTTGATPGTAGANIAVGNYELLSIKTDESQGTAVDPAATGADFGLSISDDGNRIVFVTDEQLDPLDTNDTPDVYLRDRAAGGTTTLVTKRLGTPDVLADASSAFANPKISGNGQYIVFSSAATNLVDPPTTATRQVYRYQVASQIHEIVSRQSGGGAVGDAGSGASLVAVSDDGLVIAFASDATNLLVGTPDTNNDQDVYIWTQAGGVVQKASEPVTAAAEADENSFVPVLSGDGKLLYFMSSATNLTTDSDPAVGTAEAYVITVGANDLTRVAAMPSDGFITAASDDGQVVAYLERLSATRLGTRVLRRGNPVATFTLAEVTDDAFEAALPVLSDDGRRVAYLIGEMATPPLFGDLATEVLDLDTNDKAQMPSLFHPSLDGDGSTLVGLSAAKLATPDDDGRIDIFATELVAAPDGGPSTAPTERISVSSTEVQADDESVVPAMSASGNEVAFQSVASNLVAPDSGFEDVYVRNRSAGTTERVSVGAGLPNGDSSDPAISASGRYVAFQSFASNLAAGDTNTDSDVFLRDLETDQTFLISHTGPGSAQRPSVSGDGRFVAFLSDEPGLPDAATIARGVYLRDRSAPNSVIRLDHLTPALTGQTGVGTFVRPIVADDGSAVVFNAVHVVPSGTAVGLYRYSVAQGTITTIIPPVVGGPESFLVALSRDGSTASVFNSFFLSSPFGVADIYLTPWSLVTVTGGTVGQRTPTLAALDLGANGRRVMTIDHGNAVIWDRDTDARVRVSETMSGAPIPLGASGTTRVPLAVMNAAGTQAAYMTDHPDVVPDDTNGVFDIFATGTALPPPPGPGAGNNPLLTVEVVAAPPIVAAPGGLVTYSVKIALAGAGGEATISTITNNLYGNLNAPNNPAVLNNSCDGLVGTVLTAPEEVTCSFQGLVAGTTTGVVSSTTTVTATVGAVTIADVGAAAVGDVITATDTVGVVVFAAGTTGGTTGGTAGTTGGTAGTTGGTAGTTGGTAGTTGGTAGTTGGTAGTTGGTAGTTGGTAGTTGGATTTTTKATTTTTVTGATSTTATGATSTSVGGGTATTAKPGGAGIAKTGANSGRLFILALGLLGVGFILSGQGITLSAPARRRR